jgi:RND family efflux transporter MFP subunit
MKPGSQDMIKKIAIILLSIISLGVAFAALSCSSQSSAAQSSDTQVITAQKGTIKREITPSGNLQMPREAKLTFGASSGTISQVLVKVGDTVEENQVLARLDATTLSGLQQSLLQAQIDAKTAKLNLERSKTPSSSSSGTSAPDPLDIETKELGLQKALMRVDAAQAELDGAEVDAPFAGLVSQVNSKVGDRISSSTVVIRLIDPTQLGVTTMVNETDIFNIKLGTAATVQIDALPQVSLPATVSAISPTATISGGVVNFPVELKVQTTPTVRPAITGTRQPSANLQSTSSNSTQASNAGSQQGPGQTETSSNAQAQASRGTQAARGNQSSSATTSTQRLNPAVIPTLKEGLSVSITVTIEEKNNVILVPSRAVTRQGANSIVQVQKTDNTTEQRIVKTGISDWQNVEITEGLTEGEKLVVSKQTASTTTPRTTTQQPARIPGIPNIGR